MIMNSNSIDHAAAETSAFAPDHGITIQDASSWVLRIGVIVSVAIMLIGIIISFCRHQVAVERMQHALFVKNPAELLHGLATLRGKAFIEAGVYLLVLTPIMRVVTSMILFVFAEKDWLYGVVTFFVLVLTLAGLLLLK